MEPKKRVTQEDIARACKIDQGSVSRILNEDTRDSFAEETVQKVFKVAGSSAPAPSITSTAASRAQEAEVTGASGHDRHQHGHDEGEIDRRGVDVRHAIHPGRREDPPDGPLQVQRRGRGKLKGFKARRSWSASPTTRTVRPRGQVRQPRRRRTSGKFCPVARTRSSLFPAGGRPAGHRPSERTRAVETWWRESPGKPSFCADPAPSPAKTSSKFISRLR